MNAIVLTNKALESIRLKRRLRELDSTFANIQCLTKEELTTGMKVEYIFSTWYMPSFTEDEIRAFFPKLKAIFYAAGTVKQFALPFLKQGIRVFSAAKVNGIPVAEFTVGQILLANKGYFQSSRRYKWPIWSRGYKQARDISENHQGNYNSTVGILGCGAVGSMVVSLLKPYELKIKVYDPYLTNEHAKDLGVEKGSLEDIFSSCSVISNHMPDITATKGIINKDLLKLMQPYATLINTGRGAQIIEKDLASVLGKRKDLCALLDVASHEPLFPWSRLYWRKNVFLSPHIAGSLSDEINRMIDYSYQSYIKVKNGEKAEGEVSIDQLERKA
ncbi:MAG: hydroxyacid dehydrogenase [Barnesiella sp.]|nr:hydroxyacid dehydrogenase [Barnesiella sp.]